MYFMFIVYASSLFSFLYFYSQISHWLTSLYGETAGSILKVVILVVLIIAVCWQIFHIIFRILQKKTIETDILPNN
jgi:TRAP-type C4-dicarboxylate transport system permease large subunit